MIRPMIAFAGFKELDADFKLLSNVEQRKVSRKAVRAGAVVFRDAVRASAPVRSGVLKRSISVDTVKGSPTAGVKFKKVLVKKKVKKVSIGQLLITGIFWRMGRQKCPPNRSLDLHLMPTSKMLKTPLLISF